MQDLSVYRHGPPRASAYPPAPASAGQYQIFAGNSAYEDAWGSGGRVQLQSLPSFTQAFLVQAFFTFDFIPQTLPSLFGPVDRAGPAACVRDYAAGARRCRLLGRLCAARARAGSRSSAANAAAVTGSSIRSGSPCRARERRASSAPARRSAWRSSLLIGRPADRLPPFARAVNLPAPRPAR